MSRHWDDDTLDAALGKLGLPMESRPVATPTVILGRLPAAPVTGIGAFTGMKLAAMVAAAVGIGFGGGLLAHEAVEAVVAARVEPLRRPVPIPDPPKHHVTAPVPQIYIPELAKHDVTAPAPMNRAPTPVIPVTAHLSGSIPTEHQVGTRFIAPEPRESNERDLADLPPIERPEVPATAVSRTRVAVTAAGTAAFGNPDARLPPNGVLASVGVVHRTSDAAVAPFSAAIADIGLLAGRDGQALTGALTGVGGVSWEFRSARLDLGWAATARGLGDRSPDHRGDGRLLLGTGPRLALSVGEPDRGRLRLEVAPQLLSGGPARATPWLEVAIGFDFGVGRRSKAVSG